MSAQQSENFKVDNLASTKPEAQKGTENFPALTTDLRQNSAQTIEEAQKEFAGNTNVIPFDTPLAPQVQYSATPITSISMLQEVMKTESIIILARPNSIGKATGYANAVETQAQDKIPVYICNFPEGKNIRVNDGDTSHLLNLHSAVVIHNLGNATLTAYPLKNHTTPAVALQVYNNPNLCSGLVIKNWDGNFKITNY